MAWKIGFPDMANSRPLFLTIYAIVLSGVIFSGFYVFFFFYSSNTASSSPWFRDLSSASFSPALGLASAPNSQPQLTSVKSIWEVPSSGSKMPSLKTFQLKKQLVQERVENNIVIVTFGNYAFLDFILNWAAHLTKLGLSNFIVGAMDIKLLEALYWRGVPVFDMGSHMSTMDVGWGTPIFHKMGREKVFLINAFLPFGYELLMCDTDMVWLKNPLPYFARFPGADVLTSSDQVVLTVVDDRLDIGREVTGAYNIGIFYWRPTVPARKLAKEWKDMLLKDDKMWDQHGFNELLNRQLGPSVDGESGLFYAFDGTLKLGLLPVTIFCSGHTYFVQAMFQQLRLKPYAVHTTFQYGGTEGKRHRLREALLFYDSPEYYDPPGGLLSFMPFVPKSLFLDGEHSVDTHFSLINHQIKQIRTALAISTLLNRTLVMPPIWCRLDRLWFPHPGVLAGSLTRQPFLCPLDHVFELHVMSQKLSEDEFGPGIDFREYSFFENPAVPRKVKDSWLQVQLCHEGTRDCNVANNRSTNNILRFPKHSSEETFKTVFSAFKDVRVVQFSSLQDAFAGFTDKVKEKKFRNRIKRYVSLWCCVKDHIPGHIYYDIFWDEKPGWKPIPPQSPQDDHPPL